MTLRPYAIALQPFQVLSIRMRITIESKCASTLAQVQLYTSNGANALRFKRSARPAARVPMRVPLTTIYLNAMNQREVKVANSACPTWNKTKYDFARSDATSLSRYACEQTVFYVPVSTNMVSTNKSIQNFDNPLLLSCPSLRTKMFAT